MVEYKGPMREFSLGYRVSFVRVEGQLFVGVPNDTETTHGEIADQDRQLEKVQKLSDQNPAEVDAGTAIFNNKKRSISPEGGSADLGLPVKEVRGMARRRTVQEFSRQTPGYTVTSH